MMHTRTMRLALLGATLLTATTGLAMAQTGAGLSPGATYDPAQLPAFHGKVAQYDVTPRGDVDGLILDDGTEIHFPPHLGTQVVAAVKPGDAVTVHGLKARELNLIQGMSVTNDASRATVVDNGPAGGPPHGPREGGMGHGPRGPGWAPPGLGSRDMGSPMEVHGAIKMQLHGPRGDVNGVLLADGTAVHMPPPEATRLSGQLAAGQTVFVQGRGNDSVLGRSVEARAIGPSADKLTPLQGPRHFHGEPPAPPAPDQSAPK